MTWNDSPENNQNDSQNSKHVPSQTNSNSTLCMTVIILITSMKEIYFDASHNTSNGKHLHHGSNFMQTPLYDSVSPNVNSGATNTTNTLIFVCYNHTKHQMLQNQLIDLHATLRHDSISPYHNKQIKITKTVITTTNKTDHSNNNATFRTINETSKQPAITHHSNLVKNNLVQTISRLHK